MNFKILLMLFILGCGVKGPPKPPQGTELPPLVDEVDIQPTPR